MIRIRVEKTLDNDYNEVPRLTLQSSKRGTRSINLPLAMDYEDAVEAAKLMARAIGPSTLNAVKDDYIEVDVHR